MYLLDTTKIDGNKRNTITELWKATGTIWPTRCKLFWPRITNAGWKTIWFFSLKSAIEIRSLAICFGEDDSIPVGLVFGLELIF